MEITLQKFTEMIQELIEQKRYKELLELLPDIEAVKEVVDKALSDIKEYIKYEQIDELKIGDYQVQRNVYFKYKPIDIKELINRYPVDKYSELYNISLSAKAKKVIDDPELITKVPIETVRIQKIKEEDNIDL